MTWITSPNARARPKPWSAPRTARRMNGGSNNLPPIHSCWRNCTPSPPRRDRGLVYGVPFPFFAKGRRGVAAVLPAAAERKLPRPDVSVPHMHNSLDAFILYPCTTDSERVRLSRRLVLEFLASSVDLSLALAVAADLQRYGAHPERFGLPAPGADRDARHPGHHEEPAGQNAATVAQPVKIDNELYIRDYSRCILCYKCVEACGVDAQNTFAIAVAGRGFDARISTEFAVPLPDSACVYCGNCIGVCPTGARCSGASTRCARRETGTRRSSATRTPSVPIVASGARSPCMCRTIRLSKSPHLSIMRSVAATSVSKGGLAGSLSRTAERRKPHDSQRSQS